MMVMVICYSSLKGLYLGFQDHYVEASIEIALYMGRIRFCGVDIKDLVQLGMGNENTSYVFMSYVSFER